MRLSDITAGSPRHLLAFRLMMDLPAASHAATATPTPVDEPVTTAYSVPILHFSGDSVGIQSCVPLNNVFSCMVRNPDVPQMPEQIVETVSAIPQEWISERIVDIPVVPAEEQTVFQVTYSAPAPVIEYVTPSPLVEFIAPAPSATMLRPVNSFLRLRKRQLKWCKSALCTHQVL